jgi:hypothetical protein
LSFPYPIGWDTIYYADRIKDGVVFAHRTGIFSTWLLYGIIVFFGNLTKLDPFLLLKIIAPLLYGGCSSAMFFVAWKRLNWNITESGSLWIIFFSVRYFINKLAVLSEHIRYYDPFVCFSLHKE